jgi:hypothetical protein
MSKKILLCVYLMASTFIVAGCVTTAPTVSTAPTARTTTFDRFTPDLPQLLETDALTVLTLGMTNDFATKVCMRAPSMISSAVSQESDNWKKRNARFTRGASAAINEISTRIDEAQGNAAKQSYLNQMLQTTAGKANSAILRKLDGASLDNAKVPTAQACFEIADYLRSGAADFDRTLEYTRELSKYMERRGIK